MPTSRIKRNDLKSKIVINKNLSIIMAIISIAIIGFVFTTGTHSTVLELISFICGVISIWLEVKK